MKQIDIISLFYHYHYMFRIIVEKYANFYKYEYIKPSLKSFIYRYKHTDTTYEGDR